MNRRQLEQRTLAFAASAFRLVGGLSAGSEKSIIGNQLLRAACSVGANYREANRAESRRDFVHKLAVAEKEVAEALYWLELLRETGAAESPALSQLLEEAEELLRIFYVARRTMRRRAAEEAEHRAR